MVRIHHIGMIALSLLSGLLTAGDAPLTVCNVISTRSMGEQAMKAFAAAHPGPELLPITGLTVDAIKKVGTGEYAMATVVRDLKDAEKKEYPDIHALPFAFDMVVMAVHRDNPITDLTPEQVRKLYTGEIASWKELGGNDAAPAIVARIDTFATLEFFDTVFGLKRIVEGDGAAKTLRYAPNGPVAAMPSTNEKAMAAVIANPQAVTFTPRGLLLEMQAKGLPVKSVTLGGVAPTDANARNGSYLAKRRLYVLTPVNVSPRIKEFIDFLVSSPEGRSIIAAKGFIPMED
jgi:phosphate transport system substrate-binding protein